MPIPSVKGDFGQGGGRACGGFGFCRRVPFATAPLSCPHLMASRWEERDYGALPSEQRSEPCVTVADSPTQPTGFNHVCSPSMFSLFLFHFISPRLCFSLPSSILLSLSLSLCTGILETFFSCLWQARQMKNKFQIWSEHPFSLWLFSSSEHNSSTVLLRVCVCGASVVYVFPESLNWRMCLGAFLSTFVPLSVCLWEWVCLESKSVKINI